MRILKSMGPFGIALLIVTLPTPFARTAAAQDTVAARDTLPDTFRSGFRLSGDRLRRLPIDDPRHALVLIPGVRLTSPDIGITPGAALLIRGSPAGRGNVYVDGAPLRFQTLGGAGVEPASNAIGDVTVLTGVAPAFVADAGGGVIAYETRSGGDRLGGDLRWGSGRPFSDAASVGYNRIEGMLGGPLARARKLTFLLSGMLQGQRSSYRGLDASTIPAYMPAETDTIVDVGGTPVSLPLWQTVSSGLRRPLDWSTARHMQAKLQYQYGVRSSLSLTLLGGDVQQRAFPGPDALVPALYAGQSLSSAAAILNWHHALSTWHGGALALEINLSIVRHRDTSGPLHSTSELATRDPTLGISFQRLRFAGADTLGLPATETLVRDVRTFRGLRGVPLLGKPDAYQSGRQNPFGMQTAGFWPTAGFGGTLDDFFERRLQGRWKLAWSLGGIRQFAIGIDLERSNVSSYSSDVVREINTDIATAQPRRIGLFSDNRIQFAQAVIDFGIRLDRFSPNGALPIVPAYISSSGPALWNPNSVTDDTAYANSVARVFRRARGKSTVSPPLAFSYPAGARAALRLGFCRSVGAPSWRTLFIHSNNDLSFTDVRALFGRDIDFATAGLIEGSLRYTLGPTILDVGVHRNDVPIYAGRLTTVADPRDSSRLITVNTVSTFDRTAQGVDVGVEWRKAWFMASGAYSLVHTTNAPGGGLVPAWPFM